jgi:hypothetical protein
VTSHDGQLDEESSLGIPQRMKYNFAEINKKMFKNDFNK